MTVLYSIACSTPWAESRMSFHYDGHPIGSHRIETDLDQGSSGPTDAAPACRPAHPARISFFFNKIDARNSFTAPAFTGATGCDIWNAGRFSKAQHDRRRPTVSKSGSTRRE